MTKEKEPDNKSVLMVTGLSRETKQRFKMLCLEREVSMSEIVVCLVKAFVEGKIDAIPPERSV